MSFHVFILGANKLYSKHSTDIDQYQLICAPVRVTFLPVFTLDISQCPSGYDLAICAKAQAMRGLCIEFYQVALDGVFVRFDRLVLDDIAILLGFTRDLLLHL